MELRSRADSVESCVYCWDALDAEAHTCPGCQAQYHLDCLSDELRGKCATIGCAHAAAPSTEQHLTCRACTGRCTGSQLRTCPGCQATYHRNCLLEELNGRCSTPGCTKVLRVRDRHGQVLAYRGDCAACTKVIRNQPYRTCPGCTATYHRRCLVETLEGRCATLGCTKVLRTREVTFSEYLPAVRTFLSILALLIGIYGVTSGNPRAAIGMGVVGALILVTHLLFDGRKRPD